MMFDAEGRRTGGARMTAVVTLKPGETGRHYRLPTEADYEGVRKAQERVAQILEEWERSGKQGLCPVPDEPTPAGGGSGAGQAFSVQRYGMMEWGDLFTARQKVAIGVLNSPVRDNSLSGTRSVLDVLALSFGKLLRHCNVISKWHRGSETVAGAFGMQTLPMSWDFPEMYPIVALAGGIENCVEDVASSTYEVASGVSALRLGQAEITNSVEHPLPDETASVWFTDPPYYDASPIPISPIFFLSGSNGCYPITRCCTIRSIRTIRSRSRQPRLYRTKPSRPTVVQKIASGLRRRWRKPSPRDVVFYTRMV